jgi:D-alanyl-lipoteichoic acid acyltransferase DltB (MBOAT superfamily)
MSAADTAPTAEDRLAGLRMIGYGLFKKYVVANRLTDYVLQIFPGDTAASVSHYSTLPTALGCVFNALNLYADFSSYVDIAVGSARFLGFRLDPNFNRPFLSTSVTEFWRRWHMTLSFWLRDYLFMPLLISIGRLGTLGVVIAVIFTFAICGLWHGATWTYILFGISQGVAMSIEISTKRWRTRLIRRLPKTLVAGSAWLYTVGFFVLSEVFFRASSLPEVWNIYGRLTSYQPLTSISEIFAAHGPFDFALALLVTALWFGVSQMFRAVSVATPLFLLACSLMVLFLGRLGNGQFIYAGF